MGVINLSGKTVLKFFRPDIEQLLELPYFSEGVKAGFPSPALDFMGEKIDMNREMVQHPMETFYVRVNGTSMTDAGLEHGDIIVVDRSLSLPPEDGKIYICTVDNEFTVKTVKVVKKRGVIKEIYLMPANEEYKPILVTEDNEFEIWGRVTHIIKKR